jgi:uncharacterized protein YegL
MVNKNVAHQLKYYKERLMNNHKQKSVLIFIFFIFFEVVLLPQGPSGTRGFDFVVIVDQSGSMSGTLGAASDRLGVRNDMVKRTFQLLAKDGALKNVTHRFGVISFGDDVRIDLPLSQINRTNIETLQQRLNSSLGNESMGSTHFLRAFAAAQRMFDKEPLAEPGKRAILLITDGAPYVEGIQISSYVRELREMVEVAFPHPDYQLHVVALNDPSSNYWEQYGDFWRNLSHNNAFKLKGDKEEIFRELNKVIGDIIGTSPEHISKDKYDNVVIPPYLESVVFDIFRVDPGVEVNIFPPDNREQPISGQDKNVMVVKVGSTIEAVAVKHPKPGIWEIRKPHQEDRVDVYIQKFFPRGKLLYPSPDEPIRQFEKIPLKYRVEDENQKPIEELPGYPLTLELSLVKPDGKTRVQMGMKKSTQPNEKSVFVTSGEIGCDAAGIYKAEVVIATKDIKNRQVTLFRDQYSRFQVRAAHLIEGKLLSPEPLENISLFDTLLFVPKSLVFTFKFTDEEGNSLNLPAFLGNSTQNILNMYAVTGDEEKVVPMTFSYREDGLLTAKPGGLQNPGKYHLKFRPNNAVVPSYYTVKLTPEDFFFKRGLTLLHWFQVIGLAAVLLFLAGVFGYTSYLNLRFPLKGTLYIDRLGDRPLAEYPLMGKRHKLQLKEFPNETMIKKIILEAVRDKRGGITVIKVIGNKKEVFLEDRTLHDRGTAILNKVPYVLRYRVK